MSYKRITFKDHNGHFSGYFQPKDNYLLGIFDLKKIEIYLELSKYKNILKCNLFLKMVLVMI